MSYEIKQKVLDQRTQRAKKRVRVDFFKSWSAEMAYVMGYFCADGCMFSNSGGSKYISFVSIDHELLENVKIMLQSTQDIKVKKQSRPNCKPTFLLQIGSKEIYNDISKLGLLPNKELRLKPPSVPSQYFRHFLRGYFDGDGCISSGYYKRRNRKSKVLIVSVRFASGTKSFLESLKKTLYYLIKLKGGSVSKSGGCYYLGYSINDSRRLFEFMYNKIDSCFYLKRKYNSFLKVFNN
ncbi:MAG: hypothetical protein NTW13_06140 [Candidatus Omnitrophica bacterium]|nr:hypothetical protein [Candidatus Omnitrophota bacterium]